MPGSGQGRVANSANTAEIRAAFMAGFAAAGEGWNGEHPFNFDATEIDNALDGAFNEWLTTRTKSADPKDDRAG